MKARIAERGQVTIPKVLRKRMGIRPGSILDFEVRNGALVAVKADAEDPVEKVFGCLGKNLNTDAFVKKLRGD